MGLGPPSLPLFARRRRSDKMLNFINRLLKPFGFALVRLKVFQVPQRAQTVIVLPETGGGAGTGHTPSGASGGGGGKGSGEGMSAKPGR